MKGLLIKDFYMVKKHCLILIIVSILFLLASLSLFSGKSMYFSYYSMAIISVIPISIIGYDEAYKWNRYEVLTPVSRALSVLEKYLLLFIIILPTVLIYSITLSVFHSLTFQNSINLMAIMFFVGAISPIIVFPIIFRFGYLKGRIINIIIAVIFVLSINIISAKTITGDMFIEGTFTPQNNTFLFAFIAVILLIFSCMLSIKLYSKREF